MKPLRIHLETGKRWVFAGAVDWPGWWRRRGKGEEAALGTLMEYASRYSKAVGVAVPTRPVEVVGRVPTRSGMADFGAPGAVGPWDNELLSARELDRCLGLPYAPKVGWTACSLPRQGDGAALRRFAGAVAHRMSSVFRWLAPDIAAELAVRVGETGLEPATSCSQSRCATTALLPGPPKDRPEWSSRAPAELPYFLPSMRFIFVPHVGQVPCAARLPLASSTSLPSNWRFSLHFTQ